MSFFRNVTVFRLADDSEPVNLDVLEAAAAEHPARPPEPSQSYTIGFAPALFSKANTFVHVAEGGQLAMVTIHIEQKKVPASVKQEETDRRIAEFQRVEGKYPSKEERDALEGDAYRSLLARAFPAKKYVRVLFVQEQRLMLVGSASNDDVESVLRLLREALDTLSVRLVRHTGETEATLTLWVKNGAPHDREAGTGFFLGEAATMSRSAIRGEGPAPVATVKNSDLRHDDVQGHIDGGKRVHKLAFACRLSDEFIVFGSVDKEFVLRSLQVNASKEARESTLEGGHSEEAHYYAGLFLLEAKPLATTVELLRSHLVPDDMKGSNGELFDEGKGSVRAAVKALEDSARENGGTTSVEVNGKVIAKFGEGPDPLYDNAVEVVRFANSCSISRLQRALQIGYNRAARIVERMESEGVVSAPDAKGQRQVHAPISCGTATN